MPLSGLKDLWRGMRQLIEDYNHSKYWTDRREVCEEMLKLARQCVYRLQIASQDEDPDISHWGRNSCEMLQRDLQTNPTDLANRLEPELEKILHQVLEEGSYDAETDEEEPEETPAPATEAPHGFSKDSLVEWLKTYAERRLGSFDMKGDGCQLRIPVGQRRQTLFLEIKSDNGEENPAVLFYSVCGKADPESFEWALEANSGLSRGQFALIDHKGTHVLIMLLRRRLNDLNEATLGDKLDYLAQKADWAESRLQEIDRH